MGKQRVFPMASGVEAEDYIQGFLSAVCPKIDFTSEHLEETPLRVSKMYRDILSSYGKDGIDFVFKVFTKDSDEMIVQEGVQFYSLCAHHLVPFFGEACIAYVPDGKICGLSKLARTVEFFAKKPQVQEELTEEIAKFLKYRLEPKGVGVVLRARHLCMEMRGIKKPGTVTTTSCMFGNFRENPETREEFLSFVRANRRAI